VKKTNTASVLVVIPIGIPGMGKGHMLSNDFKQACHKSGMVLRVISQENIMTDHMQKWKKKNPSKS
jgi:hypothetical protein